MQRQGSQGAGCRRVDPNPNRHLTTQVVKRLKPLVSGTGGEHILTPPALEQEVIDVERFRPKRDARAKGWWSMLLQGTRASKGG